MLENNISFSPPLEMQANEWVQEAMTTIWLANEEHTLAVAAITELLFLSPQASFIQSMDLPLTPWLQDWPWH